MAEPLAVAEPEVTCAVSDRRLTELSGLVADGPRWWAIADGGRVSRALALDPRGCATVGERSAPIDPVDVEDVGIGPDGALWLADIGDNTGERESVATIVLPADGPARLHRFAYPDGPHDAEALVVADDGVPLIVTKTVGAAGVYRPDGPPGAGTTPLRRVGQIVLPESTTPGGPLGSSGSRTITGAGLSPAGAPNGAAGPGTVAAPDGAGGPDGAGTPVAADGSSREAEPERVVAVRTYTDAWLFRLPPGAGASGLVEALAGPPVQVPLPDEAQGEAVALTADGTLVSGSEARGGRPATIRTVPGAVGAAVAPDAPVEAQPDAPPGPSTPVALPAILGSAAVVVLLGGLAVAMTLHARRRR